MSAVRVASVLTITNSSESKRAQAASVSTIAAARDEDASDLTRQAETDERQNILFETSTTDTARHLDRILVPRRAQLPIPRVQVGHEMSQNGIVRFEWTEKRAK